MNGIFQLLAKANSASPKHHSDKTKIWMLAAFHGQSQKKTQIAKNTGGTNATICKLRRPAHQ